MIDIMKEFKKQGVGPRTVKLLTLVWPYPVGEAMKVKEAAQEMGISVQTTYKMLARFAKRCPLVYEKFRKERRIQGKIGRFLREKAYLNRDVIHPLNPECKKIYEENLKESIGEEYDV